MDHYKNPRHHGEIKNPDFISHNFNPSCGDSVVISGKVKQNILLQALFEGSGCVISQATVSILLDHVIGKKLDQIIFLGPDDIQELIGIKLGPVRLRCAIMSLSALQSGIKEYLSKKDGQKRGRKDA